MRKIIAALVLLCPVLCQSATLNRSYEELPLGTIKADGWLLEMLQRQRDGVTADLDRIYPTVCGERNGWLGGDGDQWERGPYWIDGLLPMAYILDDPALKAKAQRWVEWALASQREDGQFGPLKDYPAERGIQRNNSEDWWPRMVVLKILQQYYNATRDSRVLTFMDKYFRYQLKTLPEKPLGHWTYWARYRVCDNMNVVLWLYQKTGDAYLLDLCDLMHTQGFNFTGHFLFSKDMATRYSIHCVNLAQGIKEPIIYWQARPEKKYLDAVKKGFADIRKYNGFACGMYGGDEGLHGNNPIQGSELCAAVELMYSLEEMTKITGDLSFTDHLERIAFNALPTQTTDDFKDHQYFQQANQISLSRGPHNFYLYYNGTGQLMGTLCGYPCCLCNMHQGWPKFVQNLWYSTPDGGYAALAYSPCHFSAEKNGVKFTVTEKTCYPMDGKISISISMPRKKSVSFPLSLRIPSWTEGASVSVNGAAVGGVVSGEVLRIEREWKNGDEIILEFPMKISVSRWYEGSAAVERGPLVYALKIDEKWEKIPLDPSEIRGEYYWQVTAQSPWNYAFLESQIKKLEDFNFSVDEQKLKSSWYWNTESSPLSISAKAYRVPSWKEYNGDTGNMPCCFSSEPETSNLHSSEPENITLIPYGCTTLRISEFPVAKK